MEPWWWLFVFTLYFGINLFFFEKLFAGGFVKEIGNEKAENRRRIKRRADNKILTL